MNLQVLAGTGSNINFGDYGQQFYSRFTVEATLLDSVVNKVPSIAKNGLSVINVKLIDKTDATVAGNVDLKIKGW